MTAGWTEIEAVGVKTGMDKGMHTELVQPGEMGGRGSTTGAAPVSGSGTWVGSGPIY